VTPKADFSCDATMISPKPLVKALMIDCGR
jgi:hypothetical protein